MQNFLFFKLFIIQKPFNIFIIRKTILYIKDKVIKNMNFCYVFLNILLLLFQLIYIKKNFIRRIIHLLNKNIYITYIYK